MIKKTISILFIAVLVIVCVLGYISIKDKSSSPLYNFFNVAGNDAAVYFRVNNPAQIAVDNENSQFLNLIYENDKFIVPLVTNLIPDISDTNFVIRRNSIYILTAAFASQNKSLDFVHFIPAKKHADINKILADIAQKTSDTLNTDKDIVCYTFNNSQFYIHIFGNIVAASSSPDALKNNLNRVKNKQTLAEDALFMDGIRTAGRHVDANIFINSAQLPDIINILLAKNISEDDSDFIKNIARWFILDADITQNLCNFNGFVYTNNRNFLNLLKTQQKADFKTLKALSPETLVAYSMQISHIDSLLNEYNTFFSNESGSYSNKLAQISDSLYFDVAEFITSLYPEEITLAYNQSYGWITLIKVLNVEAAVIELNKLASQSVVSDIITAMFGKLFSLNKGNEISVINNFIVISKHKIKNLNNTGILSINSDYIIDESLAVLYANPIGISKLFDAQKKINHDFFKNIFIEIIPLNNKFYLNSNMLLASSATQNKPHETPENNVAAAVDTAESTDAKLTNVIFTQHIENNIDQQKYTLLQYGDNSIELIDNSAKSLWTINTEEKIGSDVFVVNPFNKGIAYLLFNTENKIYMIDFNGNTMRGFPVTLPAAATNSVSVFAYDRTSDLRIFIACTNKKIYLYNTDGENIEGWKIPKTKGIVQSPIQFLRMETKDYLLAFDDQKIYVFNRKGYERIDVKETVKIPVNAEFEKLYKPSRLRVKDISGKQITINLANGKITRK
ncbi:MAG: hypothetical protein LBP63_03345 [Prevotellaceae bacterium]|jgi:hypothetical protein|nr:hypothetical protein [Prevotellaceae bacterium]